MLATHKSTLKDALASFGASLKAYRSLQNISQAELGRIVREKVPGRITEGFAVKNISNIEAGRYKPELGTLSAIAEAIDVPLWVMFLPGINKEILASPYKERLIKLMQDYMRCDDTGRLHTENMAAGQAALRNK